MLKRFPQKFLTYVPCYTWVIIRGFLLVACLGLVVFLRPVVAGPVNWVHCLPFCIPLTLDLTVEGLAFVLVGFWGLATLATAPPMGVGLALFRAALVGSVGLPLAFIRWRSDFAASCALFPKSEAFTASCWRFAFAIFRISPIVGICEATMPPMLGLAFTLGLALVLGLLRAVLTAPPVGAGLAPVRLGLIALVAAPPTMVGLGLCLRAALAILPGLAGLVGFLCPVIAIPPNGVYGVFLAFAIVNFLLCLVIPFP